MKRYPAFDQSMLAARQTARKALDGADAVDSRMFLIVRMQMRNIVALRNLDQTDQ